LTFEANEGQLDPAVRFFCRSPPRQRTPALAHPPAPLRPRPRRGGLSGVDPIYRNDRRRLEYDSSSPLAPTQRIRFAFSGAESIALGGGVELVIRTAAGELVQP
jgi:hypothetical protein